MKEKKCARAFIMNEKNQILLEKFAFIEVKGNKELWVTPGGKLKKDETYKTALERELYEELGIKVTIDSDPVLVKDVLIDGKEDVFTSHEVYYLLKIYSNQLFSLKNMTEKERKTFQGLKWWSKQELEEIANFAPVEIIDIFQINNSK